MKKWSKFEQAIVVFTEKHWMTSSVMIIYLQSLRLLCPTEEKIGVIVDKASMHTSDKVLEWIAETNKNEKPQIIYQLIEAGMTSIYQPPDVVINKPLKDAIKRQYETHRNEIANTFVPGAEIKISREMLAQFIINAYEHINDENMSHCYIRQAFDLCGLNPYVKDESKFIAHLDSLSLTSAYNALIDKQIVETFKFKVED
jgi:DDE superfamily endonuclease